MRSLTKDSNIHISANYIYNVLKNRFSERELQLEKEMNKLQKEKAVLKVQRKEVDR